MSYEISISATRTYLLVRVTKPMTRSLARQIALDMKAQSTKHNLKAYLYDVRDSRNCEGIGSNYEFVYRDMADMGFGRDVRAAILAQADDQTHDFIETLCRNAGYDVRLFREGAPAIAWLEERTALAG